MTSTCKFCTIPLLQ